jgi:hypothetical protein
MTSCSRHINLEKTLVGMRCNRSRRGYFFEMNQIEFSREKLRLEAEMAQAVRDFNDARYEMQKAGERHGKLNENYTLLLSVPEKYFEIKHKEELDKIFFDSKWNAFLSRISKDLPAIIKL